MHSALICQNRFCSREGKTALQNSSIFWPHFVDKDMLPMLTCYISDNVYGGRYLQQHEGVNEPKLSWELQLLSVECWLLFSNLQPILMFFCINSYLCWADSAVMSSVLLRYAAAQLHSTTSPFAQWNLVLVHSQHSKSHILYAGPDLTDARP